MKRHTFIGPHLDHLDMFGDKVKARTTAIKANLPVIPGTDGPIENFDAAKAFAKEAGFPLMIKIQVVVVEKVCVLFAKESELEDAFHRAKSEAQKSFGNSEVYIERYIDNPKHIEVQVIGDEYVLFIYMSVIVLYNVVIKR